MSDCSCQDKYGYIYHIAMSLAPISWISLPPLTLHPSQLIHTHDPEYRHIGLQFVQLTVKLIPVEHKENESDSD